MTREERCWADLCKRLQRDPATSEESDTCSLRVAFKHALAFADAEAAAVRERCAKAADDAADHEGPFTDYFQGRDQGCHDAATAIRSLPATGEVGRG